MVKCGSVFTFQFRSYGRQEIEASLRLTSYFLFLVKQNDPFEKAVNGKSISDKEKCFLSKNSIN